MTNAESHDASVALLEQREEQTPTKEFKQLLEKIRNSAALIRRLLKSHQVTVLPFVVHVKCLLFQFIILTHYIDFIFFL
jgi:hypothetical protein